MSATSAGKMILRNISGKKRYFGYLGPRGAELADQADIALNGDLWNALSRKQIYITSFKNDLANGIIAIIKSTDVYMFDTVLGVNKILRVTSGTLAAANPGEGSYTGPQSTA